MSKAEQVVEDMALQPDPEVTEFFFGLFTREAMQAIAVVTMENARNFNEGNDYGNAEVKA